MLPLGIDSTASLPKATRFSPPMTIFPNAPHVSSTVDHAVPCNCMSFGPEPSYCGARVRKSSQKQGKQATARNQIRCRVAAEARRQQRQTPPVSARMAKLLIDASRNAAVKLEFGT